MIIYPLSKIYSENLKHPYPVSGAGAGGGRIVPKGYKVVEYITTNGGYADLDYSSPLYCSCSQVVELTGKFSAGGNNNYRMLSTQYGNGDFQLYFDTMDLKFQTSTTVSLGQDPTQPFDFYYNAETGVCGANGIQQSITASTDSKPLRLFDYNQAGTKIYSLQIKKDDGVTYHLIPCKNESNNAALFYIPELNRFINSNVGTWAAGPEI